MTSLPNNQEIRVRQAEVWTKHNQVLYSELNTKSNFDREPVHKVRR